MEEENWGLCKETGSLNIQAFLNVLLSLQISNPGGPEGGMQFFRHILFDI